MTAIPFGLVRALCDAAGVDPEGVSLIVIDRRYGAFYDADGKYLGSGEVA